MEDHKAIDKLKSLAVFPQNLSMITAKESGGLIAAGNNGIWMCPGNKHVLHVCRSGITGTGKMLLTSLADVLISAFDTRQGGAASLRQATRQLLLKSLLTRKLQLQKLNWLIRSSWAVPLCFAPTLFWRQYMCLIYCLSFLLRRPQIQCCDPEWNGNISSVAQYLRRSCGQKRW